MDNTKAILAENANDRYYKDRETLEGVLKSTGELKKETEEILNIDLDNPPKELLAKLQSDGQKVDIEEVRKELVKIRREQLERVDQYYNQIVGIKTEKKAVKKDIPKKKDSTTKKPKNKVKVKKTDSGVFDWKVFSISFVILLFVAFFFRSRQEEPDYYYEDY